MGKTHIERGRTIMWLHVEPTTRCNAWCPSCPRNKNGYGLATFVLEDLDPIRLKDVINIYNIKNVMLCGNLGDALAAKNIEQQLEVLTSIDKIQIRTNGSLRKPNWYTDLAKQFGDKLEIWFAIDGLEDTHSYYRQGTDYKRIMENAKSFLQAGGTAVWQFIPFEHNQHQIKDCMRLSQQMGFKRFEFVKNARVTENAYHYRTGKPLNIRAWSRDKNFNRKYTISESVQPKNCMHLSMPSLYLGANGIVSPCCYMFKTEIETVDINKEFSNNSYRSVCIRNCG